MIQRAASGAVSNSGANAGEEDTQMKRIWPDWNILKPGKTALILMLAAGCGGCGGKAPLILPGTSKYMPAELQAIYLGMEKTEVDKYFTAQSTNLTNRGLETASQYVKDSVRIGVAFAYRDGRLATATIWYDYSLVPDRIDLERQAFLKTLIDSNGLEFESCSFVMDGGAYVPDIGLIWKLPGCFVVSTYAKPSYTFPDTVSFRPYFQFSIFDTTITPWHLWRNILIPAKDSERSFFREIDSLRQVERRQREK